MGLSAKHGTLLALGFEVAFMVICPIFLGLKLDSVLNWSPIWLLVGVLLGMVGSTYRIFKTVWNLED